MSSDNEYNKIHKASSTGDLDKLELFITEGKNIDVQDENGCTPLMLAVCGGHVTTVAFLIAHGANINVCNKLGASIITVAAAKGDMTILRLLLEAGVKAKCEESSMDETLLLTPVVAAAANGHDTAVKLLIDTGFSPNSTAPISGSSALHLAVSGLHDDCVRVLLNHGADKNARDAAGYTALDLITLHPWRVKCNKEILNCIQSMLQSNSGPVCLIRAGWKEDVLECALGDDTDLLARLLTELQVCQADITESHSQLHISTISMALINATIHGNLQMCTHLISYGADIDFVTDNGMTPLMLAATHGHISVTRFLLDSGANAHIRSSSTGHTAFEMSSLKENIPSELLRLLAQRTLTLTIPQVTSYLSHTQPVSPQPLSPWCNNCQSPRVLPSSSSTCQQQYALTPQPQAKHSFLFPPPMNKRTQSLPGSPNYQNSVLRPAWPYSPMKVKNTDLMEKVASDSNLHHITSSKTSPSKMKHWIHRVSNKPKILFRQKENCLKKKYSEDKV